MIRINLIPHRAEFRKKQIIEYITVFVSSILLVVGMIIVIDIWSTQELTDLQAEQALLKTQNAQLSKKIGELRNLDSLRRDVESKLQIVDELQAGRFRSFNTLVAIAQAIPQNIWLVALKDDAGSLSLTGLGESSKAVANFMRALETSIYFDDVRLTVDKEAEAEGIKVRQFVLTFHRLTLAEQEAITKAKGEAK
ncbi:PilN domain-containing protein [Ghiorsea bivora]|uniref:PilN domain-containing protein n=1 Tax=Ghiorsea bivora TaxID=1485545 RepID=UPI00056E4F55|nr:PilN domain-containing protein [Ghiorsea bivora]